MKVLTFWKEDEKIHPTYFEPKKEVSFQEAGLLENQRQGLDSK